MKWFKKILDAAGISRDAGRIHPGSVAGLLDHVAFDRELRRQRALADRTGGEFVLLIFDSSADRAGQSLSPVALGRLIMERVRLSDVAGVHGSNGTKLGVILADADETGARQFVSSLQEILLSRAVAGRRLDEGFSCTVSQYPSARKVADELATADAPVAVIERIKPGVREANAGRL
jgi:hypothetical protein